MDTARNDEILNRILAPLKLGSTVRTNASRMAIRCVDCNIIVGSAFNSAVGLAHVFFKKQTGEHINDKHNGDSSNVKFELGNIVTTPTIK